MPLPDWFLGERTRRAHDAAWRPELVRNPDGFTPYLRRAEAELVARAAELGATVASRTVHGGHDLDGAPSPYIEITFVGVPFRMWIYDDQVDIGERRFEQWDAATPEEARRQALAALDAAIAGSGAPAV